MSEHCVFCRIIAGEIPGDFVYRDDEIAAFRDVNPVAPTHILLVPVRHMESLEELQPEDVGLIGRMVLRAKALAEQESVAESGYRLVVNNGPDGGQVVPHVHLHLVGGRHLGQRLG